MATPILALRSKGGVAMKWDCPLGHRHHRAFWPVLLMLGLVSIAGARVLFRSSMILPVTGGETQLIGSIVGIPDGAAEVISVPEGTRLRMDFHRFNTRVQSVASHVHSDDELNFYGPTLCWNGQGFGVVASTLSRAVFLVLDHDGQTVRGPQELPDLPYGGRTAGFRILWTGTQYAVFGMWLEKSNPLQDLGSGTFYSHLHYWLLNADGSAAAHRELAMLAPVTYPGIEGAEKAYFDVVWTGVNYFLAYYSESESGPPLGGYYKTYDLQGKLLAGEQAVFASQVTQGVRLAWNGRTIAATGLKSIQIPDPNAGNHMYIRCFDPDGTPHGIECEYGGILGFAPTVFASANGFVTAYVVLYDWNNLGYALMLNGFNEAAQPISAEYPAASADGTVALGRVSLAFDLQITSGADLVYGMAQASDAWGLTHQPLSFALRDRAPDWPRLSWVRPNGGLVLQWPDDATDYQLLDSPNLDGEWAPVTDPPIEADGFKRLEIDFGAAAKRFFRLYRPALP
jgi:hypothetical protein